MVLGDASECGALENAERQRQAEVLAREAAEERIRQFEEQLRRR
ncbi:MAG: hypothetical protein WCI05_10440 [Myxococcales bacterium]